MIMVIKDICNNNWAQEKRSRAWSSNIMISISVVSSTGIFFFYGYFWIPNFFFPDTTSVHTYSVNPAYQSTTFWIRIPELKFLNIFWIRNHVDAKSGCFLSGDVTRSSPAFYLEYCIQDGNLEWSRELTAWSGNMSIIIILRQLLPPTSLGNALVDNKEEFEFLRYGLKGYVLWYLFEQCPQVLAAMFGQMFAATLARCWPQCWATFTRHRKNFRPVENLCF